MASPTKDSRNLEVIAGLLAHCRDSARALRLDTLTYYLDLAFVAARSDLDGPCRRMDGPTLRMMFGLAETGSDAGEARLLDLTTIRTATEGCLNWALDLDKAILAYMLRLALIAASRAVSDRG